MLIEKKKSLENQKVSIALDLIERKVIFPFPGITETALHDMKIFHKEFPEIADPPNEILAKFVDNNIKLTMGNGNRNPVVIPEESTDAKYDSLLLKDLKINKQIHPDLKTLIELDSMLTTIGNLIKRAKKNNNTS